MVRKIQHFFLYCAFGTMLTNGIPQVIPWDISHYWVSTPIMFTFGLSWQLTYWGPESLREKMQPRSL